MNAATVEKPTHTPTLKFTRKYTLEIFMNARPLEKVLVVSRPLECM